MPVRPPDREDYRTIGERFSLQLTEAELDEFVEYATTRLVPYETIDSYPNSARLVEEHSRLRSGGVPPRENPHNAWIRRCTITGAANGPLTGWNVAVKDNISVAGVQMTCGSAVLEGYVPAIDATIVTRLLEAGATVIGKTNMDDMAMSTTGHSAFGPIIHPTDANRLAGGSSGGSAVVVATGEADAAIGTDQGGSIRIPSAYCGIVGLKPTYGLVPYTGSAGLEYTVDHPGPMAPNVEVTAKILTTIAGGTTLDPRQPIQVPDVRYEDQLEGDDPLRIGILTEGFELPNGDDAVERQVRAAIDALADDGVTTTTVTEPMHADAPAFHSVLLAEGLLAALRGEGIGHGLKGWYDLGWIDTFGKFRRAHGGEFPVHLKAALLQGGYMSQRYHTRYYAQAMNLILELLERYDALLEDVDLLAMPTTAALPPKHDESDEFERLRAGKAVSNTAAFNRTGHPAVSVPAGEAKGYPIGLQLVGRRFDDATVLRGAAKVEQVVENVET